MLNDELAQILREKGFFILVVLLELIYFAFSLVNVIPIFRAALAIPSLFILPGLVLVVALSSQNDSNLIELIVKGFFVSTGLLVLSTSIMLFLSIPLIPLTYSLTNLILVLVFTLIALVRNREVKTFKPDLLLVAIAIIFYALILWFFCGFPRLFTPDETSYISSAITAILNGIVPPVGIQPHRTELVALLQGRYYWIYLLASFIGSTGLPANYAGLIGVSFLIMTALASSLLIKDKRLHIIVFGFLVLNPFLFSFSALALNDLAIAFFAVFATIFFVKSFSQVEKSVSISITNLLYSFLGLIILCLIKLNLLIVVTMWIILVYIMLRYKVYQQSVMYRLLVIATILPVLLFELCLDLPYVVSVWVFRNSEIGSLFSPYLFISPLERFTSWFIAPWWNPSARTIFTNGLPAAIDYFYRIFSPETQSLLISGIILALPIMLLLSKEMRKGFRQNVLTSLVLLSLGLFFLDALGSMVPTDVSRLSLWIIPLWIPLALMVLYKMTKNPSNRNILLVVLGGVLLLLLNNGLTIVSGSGVWVSYGLSSRLWTTHIIIIQAISLTVILVLLLQIHKRNLTAMHIRLEKRSFVTNVNSKKVIFSALCIFVLLNGIYFNSVFMGTSWLYEDHGFVTTSSALDEVIDADSLVFANNYIYMRPYISDNLFKQGLLLPPPDILEDFLTLIEVAPNNSLFLISDDSATTWYEYANDYIKMFTYSDIIIPPISKLPRLNLSEPNLVMTFDNANLTTVPDDSGFENDGINHGAQITQGYYGNALKFFGNEYVSIPNDETLNIKNEITISFLANIENATPPIRSFILSKGFASYNGSYDVFVFDNKIFFSLGGVSALQVQVEPYIGTWHHFLFTYDGDKIELYIDGFLKAEIAVSGQIRVSPYDLEIGRDSEFADRYYLGLIDELQISNKSFNGSIFLETYIPSYAVRIQTIPLPEGQAGIFRVVNDVEGSVQNTVVKWSGISINENRTVTVGVQIDSVSSKNVTILISTDRFTKVYIVPVSSGLNNVEFQFDYVAGSVSKNYWQSLSTVRVIIIDNNGIISNDFLSIQNLELINIFLFLLSISVLTICIISFIKNKKLLKKD